MPIKGPGNVSATEIVIATSNTAVEIPTINLPRIYKYMLRANCGKQPRMITKFANFATPIRPKEVLTNLPVIKLPISNPRNVALFTSDSINSILDSPSYAPIIAPLIL